MRVINVIEIVENNTQGIDSFGIFEEQLSQEVVDKAEALFKAKAKENGCPLEDDSEEWDDIIGDGYWIQGDYAVNLVWSDI
jgi:hypothetical protein